MPTQTIRKNKNGIIGAIIGMLIFTTLPILGDEAINRFAPISWWVDVKSIEVSDIDLETLHQSITINRVVKRELNGYPRQELHLVSANGSEELLSTAPPINPADYEPSESNLTTLPFDFWIKKGIADDLKRVLVKGEPYYWVWVIEFERPDGTTEIERYPTNEFTAR